MRFMYMRFKPRKYISKQRLEYRLLGVVSKSGLLRHGLHILIAPLIISVFVLTALVSRFWNNPSLPFIYSYSNTNSLVIKFFSHALNYNLIENPQITALLLSLSCFITVLFICLTIKNIIQELKPRSKNKFFVRLFGKEIDVHKEKKKIDYINYTIYLLLALLLITNPVFITLFTSLTPWFVIIPISTIILFLITTKNEFFKIIGLASLALLPAIERVNPDSSSQIFFYVIALFAMISLIFKAVKMLIAGVVLTFSTIISTRVFDVTRVFSARSLTDIFKLKLVFGLRLAELGYNIGFSFFLLLLAIIFLASIKPRYHRTLAFISLLLAVIMSPNLGIAFIISVVISVLALFSIINLSLYNWSLKAIKNLSFFILSLMVLFFVLSNFFMVVRAMPSKDLLYTLKLADGLHEKLFAVGDSAIVAKGLGLNIFDVSVDESEHISKNFYVQSNYTKYKALMSRDFVLVKNWLKENNIGLVLVDDSDFWRYSGFLFLQENANLCSLLSKTTVSLYSC